MTELNRVGSSSSDTFNLRGIQSFLQACAEEALAGNAKKKDCMFAELWFCDISIANVWAIGTKVLIPIKV